LLGHAINQTFLIKSVGESVSQSVNEASVLADSYRLSPGPAAHGAHVRWRRPGSTAPSTRPALPPWPACTHREIGVDVR